MKLHFFEPPAAQRLGGLDAAILSLRTALEKKGLSVETRLPEGGDTDRLVHFHGLWQLAHTRLARSIPYVVSPHGMLEPSAWRHKWWKKRPCFHLIDTLSKKFWNLRYW